MYRIINWCLTLVLSFNCEVILFPGHQAEITDKSE